MSEVSPLQQATVASPPSQVLLQNNTTQVPVPQQMPPLPPPPPPPLLPPPPPTPNSNPEVTDTSKGTVHAHITSTAEDQSRKACQWFIRDKGLTEEHLSDFIFISSYQPVKPVIQNGPLCGMVALAMATELGGGRVVSTEDIFEEAERNGFSLQGEMFSASSMQHLAAKVFDCDVKLVTLKGKDVADKSQASSIVISALLQHSLLLFPYDADKNHGPCQFKGHKAHWALITGFFTVFNKSSCDKDLLRGLTQDGDIDSLYYWNNPTTFDARHTDLMADTSLEFKLFSHQGKSKHCGIWRLCDMVDSNANLVEAGPDRHPTDYVLPPGGVEEGLRYQAIVISCPVSS